jgi:hypothetical protein
MIIYMGLKVVFGRLCLNENCGFINGKGKIVVTLIYPETGSFYEGRAKVIMKDRFKWRFINERGKMVEEMKYKDVSDFEEGAAIVEEIIQPELMTVNSDNFNRSSYENVWPVKMFLITKNGLKLSPAYDNIKRYGDNKLLFLVNLNEKFGCINN